MSTPKRTPGLFPSSITPKSLATSMRLSDPQWDTDGMTIGWIEGRSDRGVLVTYRVDEAATRDLTSDISVRAFVGYGGGDFTLAHGWAYYVAQHDQRIYRQSLKGGSPQPVTPQFGAASTPRVSPDGRWVAYVHSDERDDCIAVVPADGSRWPLKVGAGRDFYMQPAWHPNGNRLAWIEWDHPNMPWDGTELCLATLDFSTGAPVLDSRQVVAGGGQTAIFQPEFSPDGRFLYYCSDETGWSHLYRWDLANGSATQLTSGKTEHAIPAWQQGMRTYSISGSGVAYAVRSDRGFDTLLKVEPSGDVTDLRDVHYGITSIAFPAASPGADERIAVIAGSGVQPSRVLLFDLDSAGYRTTLLRRSASETTPEGELSLPQALSWKSFDGQEAHGIYYPPVGDPTPKPVPLIVSVHGGPTSQVTTAFNPVAQFFASRGYGVLLPNYRGSTGYGRDYMLKLRESWGIYDVKDSEYGVRSLIERGLVDGKRVVIMGGSAGGYTVLKSLVDMQGFYRAGICMFGVSNMFTLASDTHKFEERYLDTMLGPLPEAADVYRDRSPIFHADKIVDPVAVFQGDIDRVVPREQSDSIVASLRGRGVPHEYHIYEGEGHGWRKAETIEAFYTAVDRFLRQYVVYA